MLSVAANPAPTHMVHFNHPPIVIPAEYRPARTHVAPHADDFERWIEEQYRYSMRAVWTNTHYENTANGVVIASPSLKVGIFLDFFLFAQASDPY